ncbi:MAG: amino acid permease [Clostridiales bacterium]|nr:amino acid permease [Clostridiales bacterium]
MSEEKKVVASEPKELKRGIRGWQVAFIGLGGVIGSCYFLGVGWTIQVMGPSVFLAFAVVGLIVFGLMISYAELLVNLPRKGTFVAYTNEFLGPTLSVGMGWSFWFNWVCYCPSEAIAVSYVLQELTGINSPVAYVAFALGTMAALTCINLCAVDIFAKIESGLAITKVIIIILFIIVGFGIWIGVWGSPTGELVGIVEDGFKGMGVNFGSGSLYHDLFPNGFAVVLILMVVVLVTFQGTEIVGLAASESQDPEHSVPRACRSVTYRIVGLYLVPILLVLLLYPTAWSTDERPIFADVMNAYGFGGLSYVFLAVVLVAAFSCANTGFYGTVRCMYGLSVEGLAPKFLSKLSKNQAPQRAVLFTLLFMWIVLIIGLVSELTGTLSNLYGSLLSMSGFTGTLAWVGIIASQKRFRVRLKRNGYDPDKILKARVKPVMAWIPWFAMIAQLCCLLMLAFGDILDPEGNAGGGIIIFTVATSAVIIPMIVYKVALSKGKVRDLKTLNPEEKSFDELYPPINK